MTNPRLAASALLAVTATTGATCSSPLGTERLAFREARARWEAAGLQDYRFVYRLHCFCGSPANREVVVEVREGAVVAATFRDDGPLATAQDLESLSTIDELFDRIERTLEQEPEVFEAKYDATLGYPVSVSVDVSFNIADEEFSFEVEDLTSLDP